MEPPVTAPQLFGHIDDTPVHRFQLGQPDGLQAEVLQYGGILRSLSFPTASGRKELVLGLPSLDAYRRDSAYLGVIAGRFANRIAGAQFELDGRRYRLTANEAPNHLHGGALGFGRRVWEVLDASSDDLSLGYSSPAGEEGYPGTLQVTARFRIQADAMELHLEARTDAATPVNLTNHAYFNLSGDPRLPVAEHRLTVPADRYLPVVDAAMIPTGEIASVSDTPFDFRSGRAIANSEKYLQLALAGGYDHCLVMADGHRYTAELHSPESGITLRMISPMPAVQFYAGQKLHQSHPDLGHGLCLEPQGFPNAPNEPRFPSTILRPGQVYSHPIRYELRSAVA
jgi:aldose 1-epimerase